MSGGTIISRDSFVDTAQSALLVKALFIVDQDNIAAFFYGTFEGSSGLLILS
jgi:hypothetical protein